LFLSLILQNSLQVDCKDEHKSDKEGFAAWVHELKEAFRPKGLLLSAAVSPSKKVIDYAYDVPSIAADLDWISPDSEYDYFNTVTHRNLQSNLSLM